MIGKYSADMARAGADQSILNQDWVNSRGVIFRFDRKALEVRVMDEQECVKSDVALSCFIKAAARGLLRDKAKLLPHETLVKDFNSIIEWGLDAKVQHPHGRTARQVCQHYLRIAQENASEEEKKYLPLIRKRTENGNVAEIIRDRVRNKAQKTDFREAIIKVYSRLIESLLNNQPYF